jgi:hypothetical protein
MISSASVDGGISHACRKMSEFGPTCDTRSRVPFISNESSTRAENPLIADVSMATLDFQARAAEYARKRLIEIDFEHPLGAGIDGRVWATMRKSAVKVFEREHNYRLELQSYQRLRDANVKTIRDFHVPQLIDNDDTLLVIEMTIVSPPFILDFGKVHFDRKPEFPAETLAEWRESMKELFENKWPEVRLLLAALERYGIYYLDAKPGNIMFE